MTGDFKKSAAESGKPSDRQIYAYNLTSGAVFSNNGEKTRGGAGCACGDEAGVVYFAGGYSDSGVSEQVEVWRYPLARRGEPKLSMGEAKRDLGGSGCGNLAIFAGGDDGKSISPYVEVWNTVSPPPRRPHVPPLATLGLALLRHVVRSIALWTSLQYIDILRAILGKLVLHSQTGGTVVGGV